MEFGVDSDDAFEEGLDDFVLVLFELRLDLLDLQAKARSIEWLQQYVRREGERAHLLAGVLVDLFLFRIDRARVLSS